MKKYNYVYKTTNKVNGKFYIGVHSTDNLDDGYLGSGTLLFRAIKKYGRQEFSVEILHFFNTKEEAYEKEKFLVSDYLGDTLCYNIASGGNGGHTTANYDEDRKMRLRLTRSIANRGINKGIKNVMYGKTPKEVYSPEVYARFLENNRKSKQGEKNGMYGVKPWDHPIATEETTAVWYDADKYYYTWLKNKKVGASILARIRNTKRMNGPHNNIIKRFRSGWIPWRDRDWVSFKRRSLESIPTFFTSDLHLFQAEVLKYSNRPFENIKEYQDAIIKRWNSVVPSYGIVYILGDLGIVGRSKDINNLISKLHGTHVVIRGNHDKGSNYLYKCGIDVVLESATIYINNQRVEMNHCPPRGIFREDVSNMRGSLPSENWHGESKHDRITRDYNDDSIWLHGHTHKNESERILGKMFDVGVDANKYTPVSISQIESWISNDIKSRK